MKKLQRYYLTEDLHEVPTDENFGYCLTEDVTELEATNEELVKALEEIKRHLLQANPHCDRVYLFGRISNAYEFAEKALKSARGDL